MNGSLQLPVTLRFSAFPIRASHTRLLILIGLGLPILALLLALMMARPETEGPAGLFAPLASLWKDFIRDTENRILLWALAALLPVAAVMLLGQRQARLRITSDALEGSIPRWLTLGSVRQTAGHWRIPREDIRGVRLVALWQTRQPIQQLALYRLVIDTPDTEIWINPFAWLHTGRDDHRLRLGEIFRPRRLDAEKRIQDAPLFSIFREAGFEITLDATAPEGAHPLSRGFDLTRHKGMLVQLGLLSVGGLYAIGDTFMGTWRPLEAMPVLPFVAVGILGASLAATLGRGAPRAERLGVGALTVIALAGAVHPALLRINGMTAQPQTVQYKAVAPGRFEPVNAPLPPIDLSGKRLDEYWEQYPPGTEHPFTLLRGDAGFHQLDMEPLHARTREFYRAQQSGN